TRPEDDPPGRGRVGDVPTVAEPPDRDRLGTWVSGHLGVDARVAELDTPAQTGFDSDIHLLRLAGTDLPDAWRGGLVLRVKGSPDLDDDARAEAALHAWLADRGFPVPRILAVVEPGPVLDRPIQIVERAAGAPMLDVLVGRPW